jgi:hypothetical protein
MLTSPPRPCSCLKNRQQFSIKAGMPAFKLDYSGSLAEVRI